MARKEIKRNSLSEQATEVIKESILSLEIPAGSRLIVDNLADKFKISRTPIREALKNLSAQGLVDYNGITYHVASFTKDDVIELYSVRVVLEELAARQAATRISTTQLKRLEQLNTMYDLQLPQKKLIDLDVEFHMLILEASHNVRLQAMLKTITEQIIFLRRYLFPDQGRKTVEEDTIREHSAIVESIAAHDAERAGEMMKQHLRKAENRLVHMLNGNEKLSILS